LYLAGGELNKAIGMFKKTLSLQPYFLPALNNLAMAHMFAGQYNQALDVFEKLIALKPNNAANYYNVAVLHSLQNKETEALDWLKRAVEKGYDNWELIKSDKDLENIRDSQGYKKLVEGH
jgi:tetratricopeptide (TPR) repeat protein